MTPRHPAAAHLAVLIFAALYVLRHWTILADENWFLYHDNYRYHLPSFIQFAASVAHFWSFPRLGLEAGGYDLSVTSVSLSYFAPHRWLGYALYAIFPLSPNLAYKLTILSGTLLNGIGWYWLWSRIFGGRWLAAFGFLLYLNSGIALTHLHQEQALVTITYAPWILIALYHSLALAAVLFAVSLTVHYPHIHAIAWSCFGIALALFRRDLIKERWNAIGGGRRLVVAILLSLLALAPMLVGKSRLSDYGSPLRQAAEIGAKSLAEYELVSKQQETSADRIHFRNLVRPLARHTDDLALFFLSRAGAGLAIVGVLFLLVFRARQAGWFLVATLGLAWLCLGFNAYAAQTLFVLKFPLIGHFRQYYHFGPYFMIAALTLALVGYQQIFGLVARLDRKLALLFTAVATGLIVAESTAYFVNYADHFHYRKPVRLPRFDAAGFERAMARNWVGEVVPDVEPPTSALVSRREAMDFWRDCHRLGFLPARAWRLPAELDPAGLSDCRGVMSLPESRHPETRFTPVGVSTTSDRILVALHPDFFADNPRVQGLPDRGLTILGAGDGPVPFRRPAYLWSIALQLVAALLALGMAMRARKASITVK